MATSGSSKRPARGSRAARPRKRATQVATRSAEVAVEGAEPLNEVLDAELRVRISASLVIAFAILVVLLILTAAASVNWLYAIVTIAAATCAGWLIARPVPSTRTR